MGRNRDLGKLNPSVQTCLFEGPSLPVEHLRPIRVTFTDFPGPFNPKRIVTLLQRRWPIEVVHRHADYLIYSVFGTEFLKHRDVVRIFFTGENVRPDFNLCDYAFSYDWLDFGDRHFRAPNFVLYDQWRDIVSRRASCLQDLSTKTAFCNFIYTNADSHPRRDLFFRALNASCRVELFGSHLRNSARPIGPAYRDDWTETKVNAQRHFKFSIACENSSSPGYTTEKLVHALAADTIPIYWGDPLVGKVFNCERIIDLNHASDGDAVERVLALHRDSSAYLDMLNRPFFSDDHAVAALSDDALLDAFQAIFSQDKSAAVRRNPHAWGRVYEERRRFEIRAAKYVERTDADIKHLQ